MKTWKQALSDAAVTGSVASLTSLAALALLGRAENGSPWGPTNAPSHWIWGNVALRQDGPSVRFTVTALVIHHLCSVFWGALHEKLLRTRGATQANPRGLGEAALTAATAAWVDLCVVPHRVTPGFQRRLSRSGLAIVYALFGLGLAAGSYVANRRRDVR